MIYCLDFEKADRKMKKKIFKKINLKIIEKRVDLETGTKTLCFSI
jgi:hypothetical protein